MVLLVNLAAISIAIALISVLINGFGIQDYAAIALGIVPYFAAKAGLGFAVSYMRGRQDAQKVKQDLADLPPHVRRDLIDNAPSDVKDRVAGILSLQGPGLADPRHNFISQLPHLETNFPKKVFERMV